MRKIIRITESDLARIVKRVIKEQEEVVLYGPDGKIEDFCKTERENLKTILRNSEIPSECTIGDDENKCAYAAARVAYNININTQSTPRINMNSAKNAGLALFECNKKNEPKRGPQVPKPKNPLEIGFKEPKTFG